MPNLSVTDFLIPNQVYTFSIQPSGVLAYAYRPSATDLLSAFQNNPLLGSVSVNVSPASWASVSPDIFLVTFTYMGDGQDQVSDIFQSMLDDLSSLSISSVESMSFVAAVTGTQGVGSETTPGVPQLDSSSLWAVAVIVLLAVFVLSGGASATRAAIA